MPASDLIGWQRLQGHRQITDACLWALAVRNNGLLATFDDQCVTPRSIVGAKPSHLALIAGSALGDRDSLSFVVETEIAATLMTTVTHRICATTVAQ